jgi:pimeloyl-ACP methyl ester carboxylesterase
MTKEDSHDLALRLCGTHGLTVVTMDNRGSGESTGGPGDASVARTIDESGSPLAAQTAAPPVVAGSAWSMRDMADDCAALMHSLGFPQFDMFGASMGGYVAQMLAVRELLFAQQQQQQQLKQRQQQQQQRTQQQTHQQQLNPDNTGLRRLVLACTHHGGPTCAPPTAEYFRLARQQPPDDPASLEWHDHMRRLLSINFSAQFVQDNPERFAEILDRFKDNELAERAQLQAELRNAATQPFHGRSGSNNIEEETSSSAVRGRGESLGRRAQHAAIRNFIEVGVEHELRAWVALRRQRTAGWPKSGSSSHPHRHPGGQQSPPEMAGVFSVSSAAHGPCAPFVLCITGDNDRVVPPANAQMLHDLVTAAWAAANDVSTGGRRGVPIVASPSELVVLPGAGHMFWEEQCNETAAAVAAFVLRPD